MSFLHKKHIDNNVKLECSLPFNFANLKSGNILILFYTVFLLKTKFVAEILHKLKIVEKKGTSEKQWVYSKWVYIW